MDNVHLVLHILYGHVGTLEDRAASHGLRHPAEFLDAGLKISNAMTPMNSHFPLSPGVGRPPEPGHEGDAVTQTSPPGDSRTDKCAREARAHCQVGLAGWEASLAPAPCEKVAGLAFRNLYRSVRRCGLSARLSQQAPLGRAHQIRRCASPR